MMARCAVLGLAEKLAFVAAFVAAFPGEPTS